MRTIAVAVITALAGTVGCGEPLGPDRGDPALFLLSSPATYACGAWNPSPPSQPLALFDVYFSTGTGTSGSPPTVKSINRIVAAGGTVVQQFHVNGARAILPVSAVSRLQAYAVVSVQRLDVLEHRVDIGFNVFGKGGLILGQGGRVIWMASTIPDFAAIVPDAGIPLIRSDPDLRFLELGLSICGSFE